MASGSFLVFRQMRQPTCVDACAVACFTSVEPELALARVSVLQVWSNDLSRMRAAYELHGSITSVQRLALPHNERFRARLPEPGLDCLVITFDQAKLSIVAYDPARPRVLRTIAIFNFESLGKLPGSMPASPGMFGATALAMVDPGNRAVAMVAFSSLLVVVPVRAQWETELDELNAEEEERQGDARRTPFFFSLPNRKECGNDHPLLGKPYVLPLGRFGVPEHSPLDACFLHDQMQPTLALLHHGSVRSWAPRMAVVRDTCSLVYISLVPEAPLTAAAVFTCPGLPLNAHTLIPMRASGGSVLVGSTNAIQHVGASPSRRWAMALNGFAISSVNSSTLRDLNGRPEASGGTSGVALDLDGMRWTWLQDGLLLVATPGGELIEVRAHRPEGREVVLQGRVLGAAGPFTCMAALPSEGGAEGSAFLGSRVTDSCLVQWQRPFDPVLAKRPKLEDEEEELLYGHEPVPSDAALPPSYKIVRRLATSAPLTDFEFADSLPSAPRNASQDADVEDQQVLKAAEEQAQELVQQGRYSAAASTRARAQNAIAERRRHRANAAIRRDLDLVACGPKSRWGAEVCSIQAGLRADLRAEVALQDCSGLWTVPKLLVLSDGAKTRTLGVAEDGALKPVPSILTLAEPSLLVAHSAHGTIQVLMDTVRLIVGGHEAHRYSHGLLVSSVTHEHGAICIVGEQGAVVVLCVRDGKFVPLKCPASLNPAAAGCVFSDLDGALMLALVRAGTVEPGAGVLEVYAVVGDGNELGHLVFRSSQPLPLCPMVLAQGDVADKPAAQDQGMAAGVLANCRVLDVCVCALGPSQPVSRGSHILALAAALGDGELVVYAQRASGSEWVRADHGVITRGLRGRAARPRRFAQPQGPGGKAFNGALLTRTRGMGGMDCMFFAGQRPVFVCAGEGGSLALVSLASTAAAPLPTPLVPPLQAEEHRRQGPVPGPHDAYKARGMVHAVCAAHELGAGLDFVYALRAPEPRATVQGPLKSTALRFCRVSLGAKDPSRDGLVDSRHALPNGWTATKVAFLSLASKGGPEELQLGLHAPTFVVAVAKSVRLPPGSEVNDDDPIELRPSPGLGGAPPAYGQAYSIALVRSPDWSRALSTFKLDADERVLCLCTANLSVPTDVPDAQQPPPQPTTTGRGNYVRPAAPVPRVTRPGLIIVGTGRVMPQGEDGYATGRLLVFDVEHGNDPMLDEAQAEEIRRNDARPATIPQLRLLASTDQRAPVSAVCVLEGKVLAAMGNVPSSVKLLELNPQSERLVPVGFYDSPTCVVSMSVVKDTYVLLADMINGIHFLRWRDRQFTLWARSFEPSRVLASEFVVDGSLLGITACDDAGNLRLWHFDPDNQKQALAVRGELNLGDKATRFKARRLLPLPPLVDEQPRPEVQRWSLTFCTLGGAVGALVPVDERVYRRLDLLQTAMISSPLVPRNAGLNPRASAAARLAVTVQRKRRSNILDGRLLWRFVSLERVAQRKLALSIGSTVEALLDDLLAVDVLLQW